MCKLERNSLSLSIHELGIDVLSSVPGGNCSEHGKSRSKNKSDKIPLACTSISQSGTEYVTVLNGTNIYISLQIKDFR